MKAFRLYIIRALICRILLFTISGSVGFKILHIIKNMFGQQNFYIFQEQ